MEKITVWYGWVCLSKNGNGFATLGKHSANFGSAEITIRELSAEEIASLGGEIKYTHAIVIPTPLIGGAYSRGSELIYCRSLGEARHIMQSKQPLTRAIGLGWFACPQDAAKNAYNQLMARAEGVD